MTASTGTTATARAADARTIVDRLGGSGSAGISAAQAQALDAAAQDALAGDISFSVPSGTFQSSVSVALSTTISGAQIRYTTDGSVPTASSPLYSTALSFTDSTRLRAQAFVGGAASGAMGTALYTARGTSTTSHDLPVLVIDDFGAGKPAKTGYKDASVMVMEPKNGATTLAATPTVATRAGIKLRGQSSANFEKAPYRLELRDNQDKEADYSLLGMPADSDWVLRGPFPDKTLMRDAMAYGIAREIGLAAPRYAFVEVYLKFHTGGMVVNDYQGVYLLDEAIEISKDRVNLAKLKSTDVTEPTITGGYMMKFNAMAAEQPTINCTARSTTDVCWKDLELFEPKNPTTEQVAWITAYIRKVHDSLRSSNPSDTTTGYPAYLDVDSFVNRIILEELGKEPDAYVRSMHMYKDRGGKLTAGPVWDYDIGFNSFTGFGGGTGTAAYQGWQFAGAGGFGTSDWFGKLMGDASFQAKAAARWKTLRTGALSDSAMSARVDALAKVLTNGAARNFQRWAILNTATVGGFGTQRTTTWAEQLTILKTWLTNRAAWLDSSGWKPTTGRTASAPASGLQPGVPVAGNPLVRTLDGERHRVRRRRGGQRPAPAPFPRDGNSTESTEHGHHNDGRDP